MEAITNIIFGITSIISVAAIIAAVTGLTTIKDLGAGLAAATATGKTATAAIQTTVNSPAAQPAANASFVITVLGTRVSGASGAT